MAYDYSSLLFDPMFNFGINMLAANARSPDPRSSSLGWALAQGMGGAQGAARAQEEMENRRIYAEAQQQYMTQNQLKAKREAERERARSMTLAGMFSPQPQVIGQTTDVPGLPPGGAPMNVYSPPNAEQQRAQALQRIQQLAQTDPDGAMEMLKELNAGSFPGMPKQPEPVKPAQPPGYFQHLDPEEQERAAEYLGGLRARPLATRPIAAGGVGAPSRGGAGPAAAKTPMTKAEWNKRIAIQKARESVAKLGADRATAEQMAKTDAGFKAALDLANQKMPGDDPAWEATMKRRAAKTKAPAATGSKRTAAEYQAKLDATTDPGMRRVIIETARRNGIVLQDRVQTGGIRSRLGF